MGTVNKHWHSAFRSPGFLQDWWEMQWRVAILQQGFSTLPPAAHFARSSAGSAQPDHPMSTMLHGLESFRTELAAFPSRESHQEQADPSSFGMLLPSFAACPLPAILPTRLTQQQMEATEASWNLAQGKDASNPCDTRFKLDLLYLGGRLRQEQGQTWLSVHRLCDALAPPGTVHFRAQLLRQHVLRATFTQSGVARSVEHLPFFATALAVILSAQRRPSLEDFRRALAPTRMHLRVIAPYQDVATTIKCAWLPGDAPKSLFELDLQIGEAARLELAGAAARVRALWLPALPTPGIMRHCMELLHFWLCEPVLCFGVCLAVLLLPFAAEQASPAYWWLAAACACSGLFVFWCSTVVHVVSMYADPRSRLLHQWLMPPCCVYRSAAQFPWALQHDAPLSAGWPLMKSTVYIPGIPVSEQGGPNQTRSRGPAATDGRVLPMHSEHLFPGFLLAHPGGPPPCMVCYRTSDDAHQSCSGSCACLDHSVDLHHRRHSRAILRQAQDRQLGLCAPMWLLRLMGNVAACVWPLALIACVAGVLRKVSGDARESWLAVTAIVWVVPLCAWVLGLSSLQLDAARGADRNHWMFRLPCVRGTRLRQMWWTAPHIVLPCLATLGALQVALWAAWLDGHLRVRSGIASVPVLAFLWTVQVVPVIFISLRAVFSFQEGGACRCACTPARRDATIRAAVRILLIFILANLAVISLAVCLRAAEGGWQLSAAGHTTWHTALAGWTALAVVTMLYTLHCMLWSASVKLRGNHMATPFLPLHAVRHVPSAFTTRGTLTGPPCCTEAVRPCVAAWRYCTACCTRPRCSCPPSQAENCLRQEESAAGHSSCGEPLQSTVQREIAVAERMAAIFEAASKARFVPSPLAALHGLGGIVRDREQNPQGSGVGEWKGWLGLKDGAAHARENPALVLSLASMLCYGSLLASGKVGAP